MSPPVAAQEQSRLRNEARGLNWAAVERSVHDRRALWAFWIACGLAAVAGVAPVLIGGGSNRIGLVYPYLVAALALGACAVFYQRGKPVVTGLFFIAGVAIVFGSLAMIELPLRLAVVGTCPPEPAACAVGLERTLTSEETTRFAFALGIGIVALFTGFIGLVNVYRRHAASVLPPTPPPTRRIAPVVADAPLPPKTVAAPEPAAPAAPVELDELPAPAEPLELPAPVPAAPSETMNAAPEPLPAPRPRRRGTPKAAPDAPTPPNPDS
jgi:uncharacterized membrane protein YgdD (TMEM256/DUF423 family)